MKRTTNNSTFVGRNEPISSGELHCLHLMDLNLFQTNGASTFLFQMIETGCFKELNVFGPNLTTTPDLVVDAVVEKENDEGCFPFKRKVSVFLESLVHTREYLINVKKYKLNTSLPLYMGRK